MSWCCKIWLLLFSFLFLSFKWWIQLVGWNVAASVFVCVCTIYDRKLLYFHHIRTSMRVSESESLNCSLSPFQRFYRFILFIYQTLSPFPPPLLPSPAPFLFLSQTWPSWIFYDLTLCLRFTRKFWNMMTLSFVHTNIIYDDCRNILSNLPLTFFSLQLCD